jgi:hypothetical protein
MLILHSTNSLKRGSIWRPGAAFAIVCDDAEIGRIDINGAPERDGAARISLREQAFECRIHITGKKRWTYVPARWVMYSGDTALHGATCESNTSFLTEDEASQEPIRLRRHFSGPSTLERASDQQRVGAIREVRARLLPKPRGASDRVRPGYGIGIVEPQCHRIERGARGPSSSVTGGPMAPIQDADGW